MQLTLREKWAIDSQILNTGAMATRLYSAMYGAILGDSLSTSGKDKWSGISANLFGLIEGITSEKPIGGFVKEYDSVDLITYISPLIFTFAEKFDFPLICQTVEKYAAVTSDNIGVRLGCIIYLEILFRLYHGDDFEGACTITDELCNECLLDSEYASFLPEYERILKGKVKNLSQPALKSNNHAAQILEQALWCCMHSSGVREAVSKSVSFKEQTGSAAVLAGTMAGMYFREDIFPLLPETKYDFNKTIARFLEYCAKNN